MRKRLLIISLFLCLFLFVGPSTNQMDSPSSSSSSSNNTTATDTSHPDDFKCSLNHIFKPNLYKEKPTTANKNTNTLYYYKTTHEGEFPNKVYGLFLCVFGISPRSCRNCVKDAIVIIREQCHGNKEAILWYDQCLVRYSYRPFFSTLETVPNKCTAASNADLNIANFTDILYQTFLEMIQMATFDAFNKHAIKSSNISGSNIMLLFTFAQCIPNLSTQDCQVCLNIAVSIIPSCDFQGKKYGSILIPSCYISYELYQFYRIIRVEAPPTPTSPSTHNDDEVRRLIQVGPTIPTPTSPAHHDENHQIFRARARVPATSSTHDKDIGAPTTSNNSKRRLNASIIILLAIGISIPLLLLIACRLCRRKTAVQGNNQEFRLNNCQDFSLATICEATQNFNIENKLGQGGFGPVYKGTLASGMAIAVKRLESTRRSGQGILQFRNEVNSITRLQHKNIVQLLGYCLEGGEMLLIYEFMPNKSLDAHLFDSTNRPVAPLDWKTRKKIITGIVQGLVYLHEHSGLKIIHRDIKTSNVLLDNAMNPKISDFGLARLLEDNQSEANTNRNVGTYGYMAPEYCMGGVISSKSDVYSFGVVLLEIISGLKSFDHSLVLPSHIWGLWCIGSRIELMDKALAQSSVDSDEEVLRYVHIGLLCVQENARNRPCMSDVLLMLENRNITLPDPTRPPLSEDQPNLEASQQSASDASVGSVNLVTP